MLHTRIVTHAWALSEAHLLARHLRCWLGSMSGVTAAQTAGYIVVDYALEKAESTQTVA
jgi:hypothetical protein